MTEYAHEQYVADQLADFDALLARWSDDPMDRRTDDAVIRIEQGPDSSELYVSGRTSEEVWRLITDALDWAGVTRAMAGPDRVVCGIARSPGGTVCELRAGHPGPHDDGEAGRLAWLSDVAAREQAYESLEPDARCPAHARPVEPPSSQRLDADRLGHDALPSYLFGFRDTDIELTADAFGPGPVLGLRHLLSGMPGVRGP